MVYEKYVKETNQLPKKNKKCNSDLIKCIIQTREDLENANRNFEFAEGELIDYYLYQIKATQSKYSYLIRKAKKLGLLVSMIDDIEIRNLDEAI